MARTAVTRATAASQKAEAVASAMPQPTGSASTMELVWLANASRVPATICHAISPATAA